KQNFPNPAFGGGDDVPGTWFNFTMGNVDFFMLDCRFYRQDPGVVDNPSMLGTDQKAWLMQALANSNATFKVIASSVPWANGTKPGSKDTWDGFPGEREDIFSWIGNNNITGVVLLSADRHRSDAWLIERPQSYDLYDFSSSCLTNIHRHPVLDASLFGYNDKNSFGRIDFDLANPNPTVTYTIYTIDNETKGSMSVSLSELS
ncbi:alkaline phosphatase, partial [Candidatus Bathyarchaeota archaeon]|nr:alkaline phosphatase [Candidatus Bathyarchaeota archaeon]